MSIIPKNENRGEEMVDIMSTIHHYMYVPMLESIQTVVVPSLDAHIEVHEARSFPNPLHGDYLTAARARGAKMVKINPDSPSKKFDGLFPASADWHTKLKALSVRLCKLYVTFNDTYSLLGYLEVLLLHTLSKRQRQSLPVMELAELDQHPK